MGKSGVRTIPRIVVARPRIIVPSSAEDRAAQAQSIHDSLELRALAEVMNAEPGQIEIEENANGIASVEYQNSQELENRPGLVKSIVDFAVGLYNTVIRSQSARKNLSQPTKDLGHAVSETSKTVAKAAPLIVLCGTPVVLSSCTGTYLPAEGAINVEGIPLVQNKEGVLVPPKTYDSHKALPRSSDIFTLTRSDGNPRPLSEGEAFILLYNLGIGNKNDTPYSMHTIQLRSRYALGPNVALEALLAGCTGKVDEEMEFDVAGGEVVLQLMHNSRSKFVYLNAGLTGERSNYDSRIGIELSELLLPQVELGGGRRNVWRAGARAFDSDVAQGHTNFEHRGVEGEHPAKGVGFYYDANLGKAWLLVDYNYFMGKWPGIISEQDQHAGSVLIAIPWNKQGKYQKPLNYISFGLVSTWISNLAAPGYDETRRGVVGVNLTKGMGVFSLSADSDFKGDNSLKVMLGVGTPLQQSYQKNPY